MPDRIFGLAIGCGPLALTVYNRGELLSDTLCLITGKIPEVAVFSEVQSLLPRPFRKTVFVLLLPGFCGYLPCCITFPGGRFRIGDHACAVIQGALVLARGEPAGCQIRHQAGFSGISGKPSCKLIRLGRNFLKPGVESRAGAPAIEAIT